MNLKSIFSRHCMDDDARVETLLREYRVSSIPEVLNCIQGFAKSTKDEARLAKLLADARFLKSAYKKRQAETAAKEQRVNCLKDNILTTCRL